jgi:N-acetylneuraminate synthase
MEEKQIIIDSTRIGDGCSPYLIAEMSANHNGSIDNAFRLIDAAVEAGASAIKLQTYSPDTITLDSNAKEFVIEGGLWAGQTLYELYGSAFTPWEWHAELFAHACKRGITIFSSPFDHSAVDLLEGLNAPAYKIASFEAIDLPLIRYTASTGKPMIISTGMADIQEIEEAVDTARSAGCKELALLLCVSGYPAPASEYNLRTIADMRERFGCISGLSDHTLGNTTAIAAVSVGASIIEKHFTLDRSRGGPDDSFSLEPKEFGELCRDTAIAWEALGSVDYGRKSSEIGNVQFRRSLYFVEDLKAGTVIEAHHIRSVRPGCGIAPKYFDEIIGLRLKVDVSYATPVSWESFELLKK